MTENKKVILPIYNSNQAIKLINYIEKIENEILKELVSEEFKVVVNKDKLYEKFVQ